MTASIVTYKVDLDELARALQALGDVPERVYVVDNASEERVHDFCRRQPGVEYIANANTGYGAAHNIAIRRAIEAGEDYHLVMNSDLLFEPSDLRAMLEYMDDHRDIGLLHPRILDPDGNDQFTVRMLPTPIDLIARRFLPKWVMPGRRRRYLLQHIDHDRPFDAHYVQGSFMLMRVSVLRQAGLFDERFFMYPEDIDLSRRIAAISRAVYYPRVKVVHNHRAASYASAKMLRIHISNMILYFNKWGWFFDRGRRCANRQMASMPLLPK